MSNKKEKQSKYVSKKSKKNMNEDRVRLSLKKIGEEKACQLLEELYGIKCTVKNSQIKESSNIESDPDPITEDQNEKIPLSEPEKAKEPRNLEK